jgi:hypothetical protein
MTQGRECHYKKNTSFTKMDVKVEVEVEVEIMTGYMQFNLSLYLYLDHNLNFISMVIWVLLRSKQSHYKV